MGNNMLMKNVMILFAIFLLVGCRDRSFVSEKELLEYVMDEANGLKKISRNGSVEIEVIYKPNDLIKRTESKDIKDDDEWVDQLKRFDSLSYFIVRISKGGKEIENAFFQDRDKVIQYLKTGIISDIYLVIDMDTIAAFDVAYTPMFGAGDATSLLAVFDVDLKSSENDVTFCLNAAEGLFGRHRFSFSSTSIKEIPVLKPY